MNGPSDDFRGQVAEEMERLDTEEGVDELLSRISEEISADVESGEWQGQSPEEVLGGVNAWASVASHVVARFYAPASPWPWQKFAGWARRSAPAFSG
jgi:hypothetical protein